MTVSTATARRCMVAAAVVALMLGVVLGAVRAQAAPLPVPSRSASVGQPPRLPLGSAPAGALAPTTRLHLEVLLSPRDPAAMAALVTQISTPGSPNFRHYLGPGEFTARFGAAPATVAAVDAALRGAGLVPGALAADRLSVAVTASADSAQRAFAVKLQRFHVPDGRTVYANTSAPRVRASVAGAISGVVGLNDVAIRHPAGMTSAPPRTSGPHTVLPRASSASPGPQPCTAARNQARSTGPYTIDQLASAYAFTGLYSAGNFGAGVTVGVYELEPNLPSDIQTYQNCFSTHATVSYTPVDGGAGPPGPGAGEAALDIENVIGLAPAANVIVFQGPNGGNGPLDVYKQMVNDPNVKVITTSWGVCEAQIDPNEQQAEKVLFAQAATQGQTVVAASGDTGSRDCTDPSGKTLAPLAVDDPASQPNVTGVGGTRLPTAGSSSGQTVWNNATTGAGGGGISATWPQPNYQPNAAGVSNPNVRREVPDVSADADPSTGYVVYHSDSRRNSGWQAFGGTSAAAPLWAALAALADATPGCAANGSLGLLNPSLYGIAAGSVPGTPSSPTPGPSPSAPGSHYPATAGFDLASGLGAPIATNAAGTGLVDQLCGSGARAAATAFTDVLAGNNDFATPPSGPASPSTVPPSTATSPAPAPPPSPSRSPSPGPSPTPFPAAASATAFGPAPAPPAQAANAPIRGLHLALRQRGHTLVLGSAACPSACRVAVDVRALSALAHGNARGRVSVSVHVGTLTVSVALHHNRRLTLRMSAASLRLLRRHRRLQITVVLRVRDEHGHARTQTRTMSLRYSAH